jgi:ketosteroid isomerase-like protein
VGADVAFSYSLIRTSGTMKSGQDIDRWQRWTLGVRKISGKWLITHEHVSLPVDQKSGKAVQDLKP